MTRKTIAIIANNDATVLDLAISDTDLFSTDTNCRHHIDAGEAYFIDADNGPCCASCVLHEIATC